AVLTTTFFSWTALFSAPQNDPETKLPFDVDIARFCVNDSTAQVELYIAVPRSALRFVASDSEWVASFQCHVSISQDGVERLQHQWEVMNTARDSAAIKPGQLLFTQARFQLTVGAYRFVVWVQDQRSQGRSSRVLPVQIEPYPDNRLAMSDLQLASRIERDTTLSVFYKNRHFVLPNPSALYGLELPILFYYTEIYHLQFPSDSSYSVHYRIYDSQGNEAKTLPSKRRAIIGAKLVETGGFNIMTLASGSYFFEVRVIDHTTQQQVFRRHKFFVYREKDRPRAGAFAAATPYELLVPTYRSYTEKELDQEFEAARYIATAEERKIYWSLQPESKREFMVRFWQQRDLSPETPRNEYRDNYLARVKFANEQFAGFRPGWKTDMGRVLLRYGQPDEVERYPSSTEARAFQIWRYFDIEGGVEFIFVDLKSGGEMELVHSTARNELQDPDWKRWLIPGGR
ncbi:MAG: GWxTD domain-containing protein, partial [candidate division KSB1 bacterium]|nr:GWxTD domain-containing protein [candidate division KSB1 bacterium]